MHATCSEFEPLLAQRAEDRLPADQRVALDRHLEGCAHCRGAEAVQRDVRALLTTRADALRSTAPMSLRERLAVPRPGPTTRGTEPIRGASPWRMPVAATLLVTLLLLGGYGLTGTSTTVLAAQLALDHLKCVKLVDDHGGQGLDPAVAGAEWQHSYAWVLDVPPAPVAAESRLIGVRRCLYGHGHLAHLLYDVDGFVVSLFVMPRSEHDATDRAALREVFGQQTRVWASGDQTFALVADVNARNLTTLEQHFRAGE